MLYALCHFNFASMLHLYVTSMLVSVHTSMLYAIGSMLYALCIEVKCPNGFKPKRWFKVEDFVIQDFSLPKAYPFTC